MPYMAEEKGKVVLFGTRWSGRAPVAKMLVSGELKDCSLEPTNSNSECETYVGRGWTVIDTMDFGEPLGGIVPEEYVRKMVIDFLNEVRGRYSHIIFVVDRADFPLHSEGVNSVEFMWRTFLETFKGGEENFVVLVTNEWPAWIVKKNELDVRKMFPECKHFLYLGDPDPKWYRNDGHAVSRIQALERFEKEMEMIFTAVNCPWTELEISKMGDAEIQETAAKISRHLTSSPAVKPSQWGSGESEIVVKHEKISRHLTSSPAVKLSQWGSGESEIVVKHEAYEPAPFDRQVLQGKARKVLRVQDEMQNLDKEVKFFPRQCEYLLQKNMGASKELHDLVGGTIKTWDDDDDYRLAPLLKSLDRLISCTEAAKELLKLCGNSEKEHEVALTLSSCPLPDTTNFQVSKFAFVICDLDWSLDVFRFVLHHPEAQLASSESERHSWLSKFLWCESRGRLVYMGDGEDKDVLQSSTVEADHDRQAQDQRDLVSAMERHFTTFQNSKKANSSSSIFPGGGTTRQLSSSEIVSYMSILRNRLQGDESFDGDSSIRTVPECFRIPGKQEYKAVQLIGKGSYKEVHKCDWLGMNVAIATEPQRNGQSDQGGEDSRTVLEAKAGLLARVQHPNVVMFIGYGYNEVNRRGFQVSEILESSLRSLINNRIGLERGYKTSTYPLSLSESIHILIQTRTSIYPFSVSQSIDILLQIVEAMIRVHECGVIYRDLKADNCLINRKFDGRGLLVAITDFGTSELQSSEMGCHFNTPNKGSRRWMAPELYQRPGDEVKLYTWSADVYSFGMTCYEVVTGEVPFGKLYLRLVGEAVCDGRRPPIPDNCPDELRELMIKCWAHIPEDRPTFKEIREILWHCKFYHTIFESDSNGKFVQQSKKKKKLLCGLF